MSKDNKKNVNFDKLKKDIEVKNKALKDKKIIRK